MVITKTSQGWLISTMVGDGFSAYRFHRIYIGYTKREAINQFRIDVKSH